MSYRRVLPLLPLTVLALPALAQAPDPAVMARIRAEGMQHSQLPETLSYLTDVIGPRLTGSLGLLRANEWTKNKLAEWGCVNAKLEPWGPFGRGWQTERFSMQTIAPLNFPIIAYPKAWSTGWSGTAEVVYIGDVENEALDQWKGKLKGKIVLIASMRDVPAHFTPQGERYTEQQLDDMAAGRRAQRGGGFPGGGAPGQTGQPPRPRPGGFGSTAAKLAFCKQEGAAMVLDAGRGDGGTIFVQQASVPVLPNRSTTPAPAPARNREAGGQPGQGRPGGGAGQPGGGFRGNPVYKKAAEKLMIPQVSLAVEHYNRLARMVQAGEPVKLAVELKVKFNGDDNSMVYNTTAEIPGTDKADEVVMCGAHIDSWQGGTGATDNGAGTAVCMEAMRILKAIGVKPRRTIRIGLWSGEEQGLFGSRAYVQQHFGASGKPTAEHAKFSSYFNLDNGTGKIRGVYLQGNTALGPLFTEWLKPFNDLGATTVTPSNTGGTDHQSFDGVGLPGFQFIQDTIEYDTRTHHSNMDVYDRIQVEDMKQAATIMAAFLYNAAMQDQKLTRKAPRGE